MSAAGQLPGPPARLTGKHEVATFDCGYPELNAWLTVSALASEGLSARTSVIAIGARVVGYYCLAAGSVVRGGMPNAKLRRNMPDPVPVVVMGRLAVDLRFQGRGLGDGLVKDACHRTLEAANAVGVRALMVHAIDDKAAAFYRKWRFVPSPSDPRTFVMPVEMIRQVIASA